jgi:hypothetical protein
MRSDGMPLQYILVGGQLIIDKLAFSKELLLPSSPLKRLLHGGEGGNSRQPEIIKTKENIVIDFDNAEDIQLDEGFYDLFKALKIKYKDKVKGKVVLRFTALTSYHVCLNLNTEDDKVIYE